jgi:small subunit ribosomal protein S15
MNKATKTKIIKEFGHNEKDTGSSEVQIAILSKKIIELTDHLRANKKDNSSRRGLIAMVNNRRKLLAYLKKENLASYNDITDKFKIRKK